VPIFNELYNIIEKTLSPKLLKICVWDPESEIRETEKRIPDPQSSGQKSTGSRIPNTAKNHVFYCYITFY